MKFRFIQIQQTLQYQRLFECEQFSEFEKKLCKRMQAKEVISFSNKLSEIEINCLVIKKTTERMSLQLRPVLSSYQFFSSTKCSVLTGVLS